MNSSRRSRLALSCVALVLLAACGGPRPLIDAGQLERAISTSVAIIAERGTSAHVGALDGTPMLRTGPGQPRYGAGVMLDDGYLLTSAELVDGATRALVQLPSGAEPPQEAALVGVSVCDNLALLQVGGRAPRAARLGDSAGLRLGQPVAALGFAPDSIPASPTLSQGSVTWIGPAREGLASGSLFTVSADLLPGGSGGPLLSPDGAVVGIISAGRFATPARGEDYVIGIDYARAVAAELRESGSILSLGLDLVEVGRDDPQYTRYFGQHADAGGLFVRAVAPGRPGGGLQPGDLLVSIAGSPVGGMADLCGAVRAGGPGLGVAEALRGSGTSAERIQVALTDDLPVGDGLSLSGAATAAPAEAPSVAPAVAQPAAPAEPAPTVGPPPTAVAAPAAAVPQLGPEGLQAAREALAAERALQREIFFETFDNEATKGRWRPADDPAWARQLVFSYYRLTLKQPGAVVSDAWPGRPLGPRYIVELEVALPAGGGVAAGVAFDQQADGSGLSYFLVGADGSWQVASFQGGEPVPGRYVRGIGAAFVGGGGTNFLRVVRLPEGTQFWLNDTLVARAAPGPFPGGHVGVIAVAGPEPLAQPVTLIVDNLRLLEHV